MTLLLPATASVGRWNLDSVYNVDALALLAGLPDASVDCVVTDPPYGLAGRVFDFPHKRYSAINEEWDTVAPTEWMELCTRILKPGGSVICFGGRQSIYKFASTGIALGWKLINDITWEKPDAPPNFTGRMMTESTERALWFCPSGSGWTYNLQEAKTMNGGINLRDVWRFPIERENRVHPAQKPIRLLERCVTLFTEPGAIIVDPFAGSGTTLVAARNLGRRYLGCDTSPDYVAIARNRLAQPYTPSFMNLLDTADNASADDAETRVA